MSTNCLVTKLKASIDNSNLQRLGYVKFIVKPNTTGRNGIGFKAGVTPEWKLEGNPASLYFSDSSYSVNNGQTATGVSEVYIVNSSNEDGILWVSNKYDIIRLYDWGHQDSIYTADSEDGNYILQNINYINMRISNKLNLDYLPDTLTEVRSYGGGKGNLSLFSKMSNLTSLRLDNASVTGNIASLSNLTNLTDLYLANMGGVAPYYGSITGKVETLLKGLLDTGKTSGTIRVDVHATFVTIKGLNTRAGTSNEYHDATFGVNTITVNDKNGNLYIQYNGTNWLDANGDIYTP